jgi:hypothetical protein
MESFFALLRVSLAHPFECHPLVLYSVTQRTFLFSYQTIEV